MRLDHIADTLYANFGSTAHEVDTIFVERAYDASIAEIIYQLDEDGQDGEQVVTDALESWKEGDDLPQDFEKTVEALYNGALPTQRPPSKLPLETWNLDDEQKVVEIRQSPAILAVKRFISSEIQDCWNATTYTDIYSAVYEDRVQASSAEAVNQELSNWVAPDSDLSEWQDAVRIYLDRPDNLHYKTDETCGAFDPDVAITALIADGLYVNFPKETTRDEEFIQHSFKVVKSKIVANPLGEQILSTWTDENQPVPGLVQEYVSGFLLGEFEPGNPAEWTEADADKLQDILIKPGFDALKEHIEATIYECWVKSHLLIIFEDVLATLTAENLRQWAFVDMNPSGPSTLPTVPTYASEALTTYLAEPENTKFVEDETCGAAEAL